MMYNGTWLINDNAGNCKKLKTLISEKWESVRAGLKQETTDKGILALVKIIETHVNEVPRLHNRSISPSSCCITSAPPNTEFSPINCPSRLTNALRRCPDKWSNTNR